MNYFIVIVLCVISLCVSVVFNQDIKETSIDIHSSVKEKSDQDLNSSSYKSHFKYRNYHQKSVTSTATALADVINEFFIKQDIPFDILLFGDVELQIDTIGEIGKKLAGNYATTVKWIHFKDTENDRTIITQSAIILSDKDDFEKLNNWVDLINRFPKKLKFLIYTRKSGDLFDAPKFLEYIGSISQFQYFLVDKNDEELELATFEWFTDTKCNFKTYKVLNTFYRTSLKWQKKLENHEKFKNLHNCMVHVKAFSGTYAQKNSTKQQSLVFDMMDIVGQNRNFTFLRRNRDPVVKAKVQGEDQNIHLDHNSVMDIYYLTEYKNLHFTTTFAEDSVHFMITPGELYTSYEKILLPFDELTWYFLIATFGVAFGSIFVGNFLPKYVQDYLYGEGIKIPTFNVVGTFFGIGQLRLPTANFPRFILMIFILFCLIIRTAYQGVMFDMMTKEMRKSSPQTVDDLFEWNFSVNLLTMNSILITISRMFYENIDEHRQNMTKTFDVHNMTSQLCSFIFNPVPRFAVIADMRLYNIMVDFCERPPKLLNEEFVKIPMGIGMFWNNFLYDAIEEVMQLTVPTGIPQYWSKYHLWYQHERNDYGEIEETGAQVLRLEDLSFGFIIWLIACGVAVLGLLCELFVFAISKLKRLTRVEPIQVNNTNILQPKKPIKIKMKKAKKLREPVQQNSILDVQILMQIQDEIINENEVKLNTSEVRLNSNENLQQAEINQKQTANEIKDDVDEESESKIAAKIESTKIVKEDEKTPRSTRFEVDDSKEKDLLIIGIQEIESRNSSRVPSNVEITQIATEATKMDIKYDKTDDSKSSHKTDNVDCQNLQIIDIEENIAEEFKSKIAAKIESTKIVIENEKTSKSTRFAVDVSENKDQLIIDEEFESENSARSDFETSEIATKDDKTENSRRFEASINNYHQDQHIIDTGIQIDNDVDVESENSSKFSIDQSPNDVSSRVSIQDEKLEIKEC